MNDMEKQDEMRARLERWKAERLKKEADGRPPSQGTSEGTENPKRRAMQPLRRGTRKPLVALQQVEDSRSEEEQARAKKTELTRKRPQGLPGHRAEPAQPTPRRHSAEVETTHTPSPKPAKGTTSTRKARGSPSPVDDVRHVDRELLAARRARDALRERLKAAEAILAAYGEERSTSSQPSPPPSAPPGGKDRRRRSRKRSGSSSRPERHAKDAAVSREQREALQREAEEQAERRIARIEQRVAAKEKKLRGLMWRRVKLIAQLAVDGTDEYVKKMRRNFETDFTRHSMLWNEEADVQVVTLRETMQATVHQSQGVIRRLRSQLEKADRDNRLLRQSYAAMHPLPPSEASEELH